MRLFNWGLAAIVLFVVLSNFWIISSSKGKIYHSTDELPQVDTAIVFGTSKYRIGGGNNPFFENRIKAAATLYHSGKITTLLLSGSQDKQYYNEAKDMKKALLLLNVPSNAMILDSLGNRSIVTLYRAKSNYRSTHAILITQEYHAHRVLYLAKNLGLNTISYTANMPKDYKIKSIIREFLARPKAVLDLYLFGE